MARGWGWVGWAGPSRAPTDPSPWNPNGRSRGNFSSFLCAALSDVFPWGGGGGGSWCLCVCLLMEALVNPGPLGPRVGRERHQTWFNFATILLSC